MTVIVDQRIDPERFYEDCPATGLQNSAQLLPDGVKVAVVDNGAPENDVEARIIRGRILLLQNLTAEAIVDLESVVKARPALQTGRFLLGMAYYQARDLSRAEAELLAELADV